jgi:hypothetical protein
VKSWQCSVRSELSDSLLHYERVEFAQERKQPERKRETSLARACMRTEDVCPPAKARPFSSVRPAIVVCPVRPVNPMLRPLAGPIPALPAWARYWAGLLMRLRLGVCLSVFSGFYVLLFSSSFSFPLLFSFFFFLKFFEHF